MKARISILLFAIALNSIEPVAYCTQIHEAVLALDVDKVRSLVASATNLVNAKDEFGRTPLHWAVSGERGSSSGDPLLGKKYRELVEILLAKGADINAIRPGGYTPLWSAAIEDNEAMVKLLIDHGAKVNIFVAAMLGMEDRVKELLRANPDVVNATENGDMTALHWAAAKGRVNTVRILLAAGADPNASSSSGEAPLASAAVIGCNDVVKLLLDHGADVEAKTIDVLGGLTALHRAAQSGDKETIKLLLAKGSDVNAKESAHGKERTPLHVAAYTGNTNAVDALLSAHAEINAKDTDGHTPLWYALHGTYGTQTESTNRQIIAEVLRIHSGRE